MNQISQAIPFAELSPAALVQAYQGCCQLSWQQGQFNAVSQAAKPELPVLLCFGAHFSWSLLTTLAQALAFTDPISGQERRFESARQLLPLSAWQPLGA